MCLHGHEKTDLCPCCVQTQQVGPAIQKAVNDAINSGQIKGKVKWCMRWPIPGFTNEFHPLDGTLFDVISFDAVPTDVLELAESESRKYSEYLVRCAHQYGG